MRHRSKSYDAWPHNEGERAPLMVSGQYRTHDLCPSPNRASHTVHPEIQPFVLPASQSSNGSTTYPL